MRVKKKIIASILMAFTIALSTAAAQEAATESTQPDFGFQFGLGTATLPTDPTLPVSDTNPLVTYQKLSIAPDFAIGPVGIGLDVTLHFNLRLGTGGEGVQFYEPDWIPEKAGKSFLELYLPKIAYLSLFKKGDPLYLKFGSFDDGTLGNGFIIGNYSNMRFLPETRIFGAAVDFDGALLNFPYLGIEAFAGNISRFDVIGGRLFIRPLIALDIPILKNLQVGGTLALDSDPYLYASDAQIAGFPEKETVLIYGGDFRLPILNSPVFSLAAFGDLVFQPKGRWGTMLGAGGKLISFLNYGAQLRILGPDFMPAYFDGAYDLFRHLKFKAMADQAEGDVFAGWLASLGTSLLDDQIVFNISLDGPFKAAPEAGTISDYPHLRGSFVVADSFLAGFSGEALYEKYYLGAPEAIAGGTGNFFKDLISPANAVIGAKINYTTGPATLSLLYNLRFDPETGDYLVTSSLMSSIRF